MSSKIIESLTVRKSDSIFHKIHLTEIINVDILKKLINSKEILQFIWDERSGCSYTTEREQLIKYLGNYDKKKNVIKTEYYLSRTKYGRTHAKDSLALICLRRELRQVLCVEREEEDGTLIYRYVDIDMKNAHPSILIQLLKKHILAHIQLEKYVNNRDEWLKQIMDTYDVDRDRAKRLPLIYLYGGSFEAWACPTVKNIKGKEVVVEKGIFMLEATSYT